MKRHHLSKWMFASDVIRATIVLIIPLLHFSHILPLWLLISLMVIQSATGAAYNPASVQFHPAADCSKASHSKSKCDPAIIF